MPWLVERMRDVLADAKRAAKEGDEFAEPFLTGMADWGVTECVYPPEGHA